MICARAGLGLFLLLTSGFALAADADPKHKALPAAAAAYVDLPAGCFAQAVYPCALRALGRGELRWGHAVLQATPEAELRLEGARELRLLSGAWWLRDLDGAGLRFGEIRLELTGDALIGRGRGLEVVNLAGRMKLQGPARESSAVPPGYQSVIAGLDKNARLVQRELRAADAAEVLSRLLQIAGAGYAEVAARAPGYRATFHAAVESSARLYEQTVAARRLASEAEDAARAEKRRRTERENRELREMFRARYYGDGGI